jgi:hypothetical protein
MPAFPFITKWYVNTKEQKTTEFKLTDPANFIWTEGETKNSLDGLNGYFCQSPATEAKIAEWVNKVKIKFAELKACQKEIKDTELPPFPGDSNGS